MSWLLGNTVVALLMTAVVLLLGRWLRPAPTVMHTLWLLVLLKLVTPPLFTVTMPWTWTQTAPEVRTVDLAAAAPGPAPVLAPTSATTVMPASTLAPEWSTRSLLLLGWGLGGAWFLLRYVAGVVQAERRLRRLPAASRALRDEVAALAALLQVAVPDVRDDHTASCPYVSCFGRTRLVLPARTLARTPARGRAAVIAHELAHLRRGDHLLVHAEWALTVLLWWHPLFWFVRAQRRDWAELACDAWAIDSVPDASLDYATLLVQAVATPDHAVVATAVLAVRPAARAAFERRLKMILNERVPCRAPRRWLFSLAPVALTLLGAPAFAQGGEGQDVRIEIKVNGRSLDELGPLERRLLLQKLLGENAPVAAAPAPAKTRVYSVRKGDSLAGIARRELGSATRADEILELNPDLDARRLRIGSKLRLPAQEVHDEFVEEREDVLQQTTTASPVGGQLSGQLRAALREARQELQADPDLRELGITDEVTALVDDLAAGKGMQGSLDKVIKAAMKGAGRLAVREIEADEDLRELGLTDEVGKLVTGLLENEHNQELLTGLAKQAAKAAMQKAKAEIRADADLRELGIEGDVEALVDGLLGGAGAGDFESRLERIIDKAMRKAGEQAGGRSPEPAPARPRGRSAIR